MLIYKIMHSFFLSKCQSKHEILVSYRLNRALNFNLAIVFLLVSAATIPPPSFSQAATSVMFCFLELHAISERNCLDDGYS